MVTVWNIGDKVYGVHTEVENQVFTVYVTEEKIIEFLILRMMLSGKLKRSPKKRVNNP